jgi:hypothetical protein
MAQWIALLRSQRRSLGYWIKKTAISQIGSPVRGWFLLD